MDLATFKTQYPNISADDATIQRYLDLFLCQFTGDYGCMADHLQGLFTAHRLTVMSKGASPAMTVTSRRVGDVSTSGKVSGTDDIYGDFGATSYGIEFWSTISIYGAGPMMTEPYYG